MSINTSLNGYQFKYLDEADIKRIRQTVLNKQQGKQHGRILKQNLHNQNQVDDDICSAIVHDSNIETYHTTASLIQFLKPPGDLQKLNNNGFISKETHINSTPRMAITKCYAQPFSAHQRPENFNSKLTVQLTNDNEIVDSAKMLGLRKLSRSENCLAVVRQSNNEKINQSQTRLNTETPDPSRRIYDEINFAQITSMQQAIYSAIDDIMPTLLNKNICDGALDYERHQKRFSDFLKVFSRNYMYPIKLMIADIRWNTLNTTKSINEFSSKISSLYSLFHGAITMYLRNLRHFVEKTIPGKIVEFLTLIECATYICIEKEFFDREDLLVVLLLEKIDATKERLYSINESKRITCGTIISPLDLKKHKNDNKNKTDRLAMYGSLKKSNRATPMIANKKSKSLRSGSNVSKVKSCIGDNEASVERKKQQLQQQRKPKSNQSNVLLHLQHTQPYASRNVREHFEKANQMTLSPIKDEKRIIEKHKKINRCHIDVDNKNDDRNATLTNDDYDLDVCKDRCVSIDLTNRTSDVNMVPIDNMIMENEIFNSRNVQFMHIISNKSPSNLETCTNLSENAFSKDIIDENSQNVKQNLKKVEKNGMIDSIRMDKLGQKRWFMTNVKRNFSRKFISRLTDEIGCEAMHILNKSLNFGEQSFIEQFLTLELNA